MTDALSAISRDEEREGEVSKYLDCLVNYLEQSSEDNYNLL